MDHFVILYLFSQFNCISVSMGRNNLQLVMYFLLAVSSNTERSI